MGEVEVDLEGTAELLAKGAVVVDFEGIVVGVFTGRDVEGVLVGFEVEATAEIIHIGPLNSSILTKFKVYLQTV